jgi:hybrid polyketide synthase/nonribosomal peptide synthetase ACE1
MVSLAAQRRGRGVASSVVDIGMIIGTGVLIRKERAIEDSLRRRGFTAISEPEFHQIFAETVIAGRTDSAYPSEIITGLQNSIALTRPTWIGNPRFSHHHLAGTSNKKQQSQESSGSLKEQLSTLNTLVEFEVKLRKAFLAQLETTLRLPPQAINEERSLVELGIDSLMAVEVRSWWLKEFNFSFSVLKLLGGASAFSCKDTTPLCEYIWLTASYHSM